MKSSVLSALILYLTFNTLIFPFKPAIYYKSRGDWYMNKGLSRKALLNYQRALQLNPKLAECHYHLAIIYKKQKLYKFAISEFINLIKKEQHLTYKEFLFLSYLGIAEMHFFIGKKLGVSSQKQGNFLEMQQYLKQLITICEKKYSNNKNKNYSINFKYFLGKAYFILGRLFRDKHREAIYPEYFLKAYKFGYKKAAALYFLWEYHYHKKEFSKASIYKNQALKLDPNIFKKGLSVFIIDFFKK